MIKQLLFTLLFVITAQTIIGQDVSWGPRLEQSTRNRIERIVGEDQNGIYVFRLRSRLVGNSIPVVEHYSKSMILKYSTKLEELSKRNIYIDNFWHFNNRLFIYFTEYNSKQNKQVLYYQEVNKKSGQLLGKRERLTQVPTYGRNSIGHLEYAASTDSSTAVIYYSPYLETGLFQKKRNATFQLQIVDENFKTIWNKSVKAPYKDELFDVERVEVDKKGNAYILAKVYEKSRRSRKGGRVNYFYKILAYRNNGEELKEFDLTLDELFIADITFKVNNKDQLICAGFYSERRINSMKGSFLITVDTKNGEIISKGVEPFSKELLMQVTSKRRARKGKELYRDYLDEIILRSDGGAVIIAEQFYVSTHSYTTGTGVNRTEQSTSTYHYEDIIVVNINPNATTAWAASIPKNQAASTKSFSSYSHAIVKGRIHFIYNERISNRSPVMLASVDTKGKVDIKELFNNKTERVLTRPRLCRQTSKNEMMIYGERGKRYKFGKISF